MERQTEIIIYEYIPQILSPYQITIDMFSVGEGHESKDCGYDVQSGG